MFGRIAKSIVLVLFVASCAMPSGRYVVKNGKWVFVKKNTGIAQYFSNPRIDNRGVSLVDSGEFMWPVPSSKRISSHFGPRHGKHHDGIDIPAPTGSHIVASSSGVVKFSGRMRGYGRIIVINHKDGYHTVYAHNSRNMVKKGQKVSQGEVIGKVGNSGRSTGPHVHFEIRRKNKVSNPAYYIDRARDRYIASGKKLKAKTKR